MQNIKNQFAISVIIPSFNGENCINEAIESVLNQDFNKEKYEILIIDNASTDNTSSISKELIEQNQNYSIKYFYEAVSGLLSARHRGVLESKGEILVFIDDDIIADKHWLSSIYHTFQKYKDVHLVGGKNLPEYETKPPKWLKYFWKNIDSETKSCAYLSLFDGGNSEKEIDPNYIWGLNFSIRKETILELGGFNPDTYPKALQRFQGNGETGLTIKLKEQGLKAMYQPKTLVYHKIPKSRLTPDFFEKRNYFQGVCDSYTHIRNNKKLVIEQETTKPEIINTEKESFLNKLHKAVNPIKLSVFLYNYILRKFKFLKYRLSAEHKASVIFNKMEKAYKAGFQFHQDEVKNDKSLLEWILKENYWEYKPPEFEKHLSNNNKDIKSY